MRASKRVVPRDGEALLQTSEDTLGIVRERRRLTVEPLSSGADLTAVDIKNTLTWELLAKALDGIDPGSAYSPMQTPKTGIFPAKCRIASLLTPESVAGCPGPGLMMSCVGLFWISSSSVILSFRKTWTVAPSSTRYW